MIKIPPYLKKGDTIGIVCPSGYMTLEKVETSIKTLKDWGFIVKLGNTVGGNSKTYFSGTDAERLLDLQMMMDDDDVKAVLCGRGGYGMGRIIDKIDSLHAPMSGAFNDGGYKNEFVLSLKSALVGKKIKYACAAHEFNKKGEAIGELVGGNLALLAHLVGTESDLKTKGKILFIEDVGEQKYNVDRMMHQLKRSGKLSKLAGLIIGGFTDTQDTERPFGQDVYEIIRDIISEYDYPVCFDFPVSHSNRNYALKVGVGYKLKVGKSKVILEE